MIMYVQASASVSDLVIDYIEVELQSGETVSLNWDESGIDREDNSFSAVYKGVYFGEEYANGHISDLRDMQIINIGAYSELQDFANLTINEMVFVDGEAELKFKPNTTFSNIDCRG